VAQYHHCHETRSFGGLGTTLSWMGRFEHRWCLEEPPGTYRRGRCISRLEWGVVRALCGKNGGISSVRAELRAVLRWLTLARDKGFKKLVVCIDSIIVVGFLKGSMNCNVHHYAIVQQCRMLLELPNWEVKVTHIFREANQVADAMANISLGLDCDFMFFTEPSRELLALLFANHIGVKSPDLLWINKSGSWS